MMRVIVAALVLAGLSGCAMRVPDSAAGVGFDDYDAARISREAELSGTGTALPPPQAVSQETLAPATPPAPDTPPQDADGFVQASPQNPAPAQIDNPGISNENDFAAVGEQRSIETDAARIAANRQQYKVIQPTALPSRRGSDGPNIVAYALNTSTPVGQRKYRRIGLNAQARYQRNCAKYPSPDQAQIAFLSSGGPERDGKGLDPDGDGYACRWDPRPFRKASGG